MAIIPKAWSIPDIFRARMGSDVGKQRLMSEEGHHLVVETAGAKLSGKNF